MFPIGSAGCVLTFAIALYAGDPATGSIPLREDVIFERSVRRARRVNSMVPEVVSTFQEAAFFPAYSGFLRLCDVLPAKQGTQRGTNSR
jgi:hypothetical protein